ncbi:MAG: type II toxin-antitoxin system RelE/ParE family toxin [Clostridia bacterium]|nr:type II toxin-antitoxin system RelE/ParE family toxin [Clostridia bacterium]
MNILLSKSAYNSINNITDFTLKISDKYSNRIVSAIYSSIYTLEHAPYLGRIVPEFMDKQFRELLCCGYRIMYFISEKENFINVRYVLSSRQNRTQFLEVHKKEIFDIINFLNQFI